MKKLTVVISIIVVLLLGAISVSAMTGEGTELSPYLIETEEDFLVIANFPAMHYKLNNDITINSELGDFSGTFDGNGFKITTSKDYVLFSNSGTVKNVIVNGGKILGTNNENGIIDNCFNNSIS